MAACVFMRAMYRTVRYTVKREMRDDDASSPPQGGRRCRNPGTLYFRQQPSRTLTHVKACRLQYATMIVRIRYGSQTEDCNQEEDYKMAHSKIRNVWISALALALSALFSAIPAYAADGDVEKLTSGEAYEDVVQAAQDAIINRGYVIDYHGRIGDMLERTASDVGAKKQLYKNAEFFTFCSAVLSREVMEADIGDIAYCPYVVFVYEAAEGADGVTVGFRRLPEGGVRDKVNTLLSEIVTEAAKGF